MSGDDERSERILDAGAIGEAVDRLAAEILGRTKDLTCLAFVGVHNRGVPLARRVLDRVSGERGDVSLGTLDISLYRDDFDNLGTIPQLRGSDLPFEIDGCHVVLFDDVLFTGRTTRAAIDALMDYGRPQCIELAVLVDRGNRELPIEANYVGHRLETTSSDYIRVHLAESDGEDGVFRLIGESKRS